MLEEYLSPSTDKHNHITSFLFARVLPLIEMRKVYATQEQVALAHWGTKQQTNVGLLKLIDVIDLPIEKNDFIENVLDELEYILPDFMMFHQYPYIRNLKGTRIAGQPDLVVEVWSKSNTPKERDIKHEIYSSSERTEHWYIEQDSNNVLCWLGKKQLASQSLKEILKTKNGVEFDLRYLAL